MPAKPNDIHAPTRYTYWDSTEDFTCPLCSSNLKHEYNNGGRRVETLKGSLWVITNYYRCTNRECEMHEAFPAVYPSAIKRKRFTLDVWAKVIQHHFKHHLNHSLIVELMWDDWEVSISRGTVKHICDYFEMAGKQHMDEKVLKDVKSSGKIILSLDGAQPEKNDPSLWIFSDRLTGHVLFAVNLDSAPASKLQELFKEIEEMYGVAIIAVVSDKQKNIVNAVKNFNPEIPHVYCQYHYLNHVAEPIASKDSHLKTILKKNVRAFSIVANSKHANSNDLYKLFLPISEELKCAISTRGDRFKVFPGLECHDNLRHVLDHLTPFKAFPLTRKVTRSLNSLTDALTNLLSETQSLRDEVASLVPELEYIRKIFGKRANRSGHIKKKINQWIYKLQGRLKRRGIEYNPSNIKWQAPTYKLTLEEIWQEWIRLTNSYQDGLFIAYDDDELEFTNNAKEQLFSRSKHHFRALLGRKNISRIFREHGGLYSQLIDMDYSKKNVSSILLASETPLIETNRQNFTAQYATVRRTWKIREIDTGSFKKFEDNIQQLGCA
jgi:hypothetical protein